MEDDPPVGYVDLKAELERVQEQDGENLWRPSDTHWAQRGALVYAQELADGARPGAVAQQPHRARPAPVQLQADLAAQLGTPRKDEVPGWRLERDGRDGHRRAARRRWPRRRPARRSTGPRR